MFIPIKLGGLIQEIEIQSDEYSLYLNKKSGEVFTIGLEEMAAAEENLPIEDFPPWQQEVILKAQEILASDDYLPLPSKNDINEWEIMERFCFSLADAALGKMLHSAIRGAGAFRRFDELIREHQLIDQWNEFREDALKEILIDWCEIQGIDYEK
jgi:uncharacterized protein UPF0158